jgi:hypothetical protein
VLGVVGSLALIQGLVMFVASGLVAPSWPWSLTALSCQVIGAIFCLGGAGLLLVTDPRWSTVKLLLQVEMIMVTLMLVAALRAVPEFDPYKALASWRPAIDGLRGWVARRPLTGFLVIMLGLSWLLLSIPVLAFHGVIPGANLPVEVSHWRQRC